ncbi:MAG TPA: hypothetical protein VK827_00235, partial [Lysobacter sp.]|nr:hypothetical protein [Lysobacter sp.]
MDVAARLTLAPSHSPVQTFIGWMLGAWRLFRSAPAGIFTLSLLPILLESALQAVPDAGIASSKLLTPLASAWVLAMLDSRARTGRFAPAQAGRLWLARLPQLLLVSLLLVGVFAFQLLVAAAIGDGAHALRLAVGDFSALGLSRSQLAIVLASGVVPGSLLMFVGPRVLLDGIG